MQEIEVLWISSNDSFEEKSVLIVALLDHGGFFYLAHIHFFKWKLAKKKKSGGHYIVFIYY